MAEYIEREALIAELNDIAKDYLLDGHTSTILAAGVVTDIKDNVVRQQPAADVVEVRHGEWDDCECSVCGEIHPTLYLDEWEMKYRIKETPYCPNCGAKMKADNSNDFTPQKDDFSKEGEQG